MSERNKDLPGFIPPTKEALEQAVEGILTDIDSADAEYKRRIAELKKVQQPLPKQYPDYIVNLQRESDPVQASINNALAPGIAAQRNMADTFKRIYPSYLQASKVSKVKF